MTDKIDKQIGDDMENLLSDRDKKPKYKAPKYDYSRGYNSYDTDSFDFDDGYVPRKSSYTPTYKPTYSQYGKSGYRPVGYTAGGERPAYKVSNLLYLAAEASLAKRCLILDSEANDIVDHLMKELGLVLDEADFTWSTEGLRVMRAAMKTMVANGYYKVTDEINYPIYVEPPEDKYDPGTGVVYDE